MVNEQAIIEAFQKIKQEFQDLREEIQLLKEKIENLEKEEKLYIKEQIKKEIIDELDDNEIESYY